MLHKNSHRGDKIILQVFFFHNGISCMGRHNHTEMAPQNLYNMYMWPQYSDTFIIICPWTDDTNWSTFSLGPIPFIRRFTSSIHSGDKMLLFIFNKESSLLIKDLLNYWDPGSWLNIICPMVTRFANLYNGISYTGKMTSLYRQGALVPVYRIK